MLKKKFFRFDEKTQFFEKFGSQSKLCAINGGDPLGTIHTLRKHFYKVHIF